MEKKSLSQIQLQQEGKSKVWIFTFDLLSQKDRNIWSEIFCHAHVDLNFFLSPLDSRRMSSRRWVIPRSSVSSSSLLSTRRLITSLIRSKAPRRFSAKKQKVTRTSGMEICAFRVERHSDVLQVTKKKKSPQLWTSWIFTSWFFFFQRSTDSAK